MCLKTQGESVNGKVTISLFKELTGEDIALSSK